MFNRMAMSPSAVAQAGYERLMKGKPVVIPGKRLSLGIGAATRLLPRKAIQWLISKTIK
ncbi:hypothetical protein [Ammoniphilus sp. 3BR4]|uniref:hypothetical protein n=1 Tax=Ammoniphilus sp. 3BR4 TaxID=3158265 RepID=UPI003465C39B